jgi:signal transduction histidine kinase
MKKLWRRISFLGADPHNKSLYNRTLILANQINAVILLVSTGIFIFLNIMRWIENAPIGMGSIRVLVVIVLCLFNLLLAFFGKTRFIKISVVFAPVLILLVLPTLVGFVEAESFSYYPLAILILSVLPQLLFVPDEEKFCFYGGIAFYFILLLFIESFLIRFMPENYRIVEELKEFFIYMKMVQVVMFIFLHFAVYYLRVINIQFETELEQSNLVLNEKNKKLNETLVYLNETQKQLYHAERISTIGTLASGLAHEMNNPLNYILGGLEVLEEYQQEDDSSESELKGSMDQHTALKIIRQGIEKARTTIEALMSFDTGEKQERRETDIHEIISNAVLLQRYTFPKEMKIEHDFGLKRKVPVYRDKIQKVILSLLENAVDAIREKDNLNEEYIRIMSSEETEGDQHWAIFEFINSGPPIPDENLTKIFDPFYTTKEVGKGTGLGLAISFMFMKDLDGSIQVANTSEGVSFRIRLPLDSEE